MGNIQEQMYYGEGAGDGDKRSMSRQGSKKQLPQVPQQEGGMTPPRPTSAIPPQDHNSSMAGYGQFFLEYALLAEYNQLHKQKLPGVYVIPSAKSPLHWFGVLFIRQGLYQEGVFKFDLLIPENYPDGDCPRLIFHPAVFHPIIDPISGELDVKRAFTKWKRNINHLWQVLLYARRVFYKIDTKSPLNQEAATLYEEDCDMFKSRVCDTVELSKLKRYDPPYSDDPHAIKFSRWDESKHGETLRTITTPKIPQEVDVNKNAQTSGLSWIKPGNIQIFSKD
ncbi:AKT-interacting protein isoform X1 [Strongylocentrotus purpuratus]|uniref:UBC core domain-containing protein n=2 Tax=Strongylocentrotus purpuratus TaxID=7668 RepID=A0A7M7RE69_STRPU|nr:AKT-interacting protein isoform X1 [Strongylocentrotus purpuratus]|eukprot:XP_784185.3 PREDICTED: AKT-interacting protein isoform X1 [Strongylocentrotus purpuratus]